MNVMDDVQREPRVTQDSSATPSGETPETPSPALGRGRLLANPRRVRRA